MPRKKKTIKRRRKTNASSSFPQKRLHDDIFQISGTPKKKILKPMISASVSVKRKYNVGIKTVLTPLERLNLLTTSGTSKQSQPIKCNRTSRNCSNNKSIDIHCENGELKRLYSPFTKFLNKTNKNLPMMPHTNQYSHVGLSPREKSYLISTFQSKSSRYKKLKSLAANAMETNKIFTIYGACNIVRQALLERGWIERVSPNKMNLSRIRNGSFSNQNDVHNELERLLLSNLVEKCCPGFIWTVRDDQHESNIIDMNKENTAIVNKLKVDAIWTSKQGLCSSIKRNCWFYIENVADVNSPRTYNSYESGETEGFIKDFQITACTSLLKWILSMVANERPIFVETGKISLNIIVFALNRCKEYLLRKQNKDIDKTLNSPSNGQWTSFLIKYYCIIGRNDVFASDKEGKLPLYLIHAKFLLKEIHKYRPQLSCEGCHNIWIIKPGHCSRGRGIRMASKLAVITSLMNKTSAKFVIQKYIEEPLLIHETKFDIRQYYLITSTYPLVIWMYRDCYLKFSSQKYNLRNYHESIHLTNNAVQRKYKNCIHRHADLPQCNMWGLDKYREYLVMIGKEKVWDNIIYPGMKKSIVGIMLSCQDALSVSKNRFELYGCDFILDKAYKPWLIEINSCPDLNATTHVTAKICPAVLVDIIKVVVDQAHNPKCSTGKFECIYHQPMTIPKFGGATDLMVRGYSLSLDYFYKGKLQIRDCYNNADIGKETDIQYVLNRLKHDYENDVMVEPDDDHFEMAKDAAVGINTESEYELSVAATVVNSQVDELFDKITSKCSNNCAFRLPVLSVQEEMGFQTSTTMTHVSKSETDVNCSLQKPDSRFTSVEDVTVTRSSEFNKLENRSNNKATSYKLNFLRGAFKLSDTIYKQEGQYDMLEATAKIVSFMERKEREHYEDIRKLSNKR